MNSNTNPPNPPNPPLMRFNTMVRALGVPVRCAILGALSDGEARMVKEIAKIIGQSPGLVSQHLTVLRGAGLVVLNRRLYQVPKQYVAAADKRHLDFGHCLLRLPDANGQPTL
jgi:DNA-binding transcriptional ArsR family regulator